MKTPDYVKKSFINAGGTFIYVSAVAWVLSNGQKLFGNVSGFAAPLLILTLLVVSASITGLLVLGKPIHLYLNGFKKEAFVLLFATLAWLLVFIIFVAAFLFKFGSA